MLRLLGSLCLALALAVAPAAPAGAQPAAQATMMPPPSPMQNMGAPGPAATLSGMPLPSEAPFVNAMRADLMHRFPTASDAERAGYLRYTDADETGAISYANRKWTSTPTTPSQLWYDKSGKLLGADFSVLQAASPRAPSLWGLDPRRWTRFPSHEHFGLAGPDGSTVYGAVGAARYAAAGGNPSAPTAAGLVAAGAAKSAADVRFVFNFPAIWDVTVWVVPNPAGAFADTNPNVRP